MLGCSLSRFTSAQRSAITSPISAARTEQHRQGSPSGLGAQGRTPPTRRTIERHVSACRGVRSASSVYHSSIRFEPISRRVRCPSPGTMRARTRRRSSWRDVGSPWSSLSTFSAHASQSSAKLLAGVSAAASVCRSEMSSRIAETRFGVGSGAAVRFRSVTSSVFAPVPSSCFPASAREPDGRDSPVGAGRHFRTAHQGPPRIRPVAPRPMRGKGRAERAGVCPASRRAAQLDGESGGSTERPS